MRIVCISDTHGKHEQIKLPEGDVLIVAGDFTRTGNCLEVVEFCHWVKKQKFGHVLLSAGNHDLVYEAAKSYKPERLKIAKDAMLDASITYLEDSGVTINDVNFYGSPWQPEFCNWAFNLPRGTALARKWAQIPDNTNVLITHGPPYGILDSVEDNHYNHGRDLHQGCADLTERVSRLKNLKLHCFGHLHLDGGTSVVVNGVTYVNAAICDERYNPVRSPVVVDI